MDVETYEQMRIWENMMVRKNNLQKEILDYELNEKKLYAETVYLEDLIEEKSQEDLLKEKKDNLLSLKLESNNLENILFNKGIDVFYVVTSVFDYLKQGKWVKNYYIEKDKKLNGGYYFKVYEHEVIESKLITIGSDLELLIDEIISYYNINNHLEKVRFYYKRLKHMEE